MNKKHIIIIVIILLILFLFGLLIYIFLNKKKPETEIVSPQNMITNFINANIETNCAIANDPELKSNPQRLNPILTNFYEKYEFPIQDNKKMLEILKKYEKDKNITEIIASFSDKCDNGIATEIFDGIIEENKDEKSLETI